MWHMQNRSYEAAQRELEKLRRSVATQIKRDIADQRWKRERAAGEIERLEKQRQFWRLGE
jgi:hypothetical protein